MTFLDAKNYENSQKDQFQEFNSSLMVELRLLELSRQYLATKTLSQGLEEADVRMLFSEANKAVDILGQKVENIYTKSVFPQYSAIRQATHFSDVKKALIACPYIS